MKKMKRFPRTENGGLQVNRQHSNAYGEHKAMKINGTLKEETSDARLTDMLNRIGYFEQSVQV